MKKKLFAAVLSLALAAGLLLSGCGSATEPSASDGVVSTETGAQGAHMFDIMKRQNFTAKPNTQEMIDQIDVTAKATASKLTEEQTEQMMDLLVQSNNEFYDGGNQSELYLWFGYLLSYKYPEGDLYNVLGGELIDAVKDVYLGNANVKDAATQDAIAAVDRTLAQILAAREETQSSEAP